MDKKCDIFISYRRDGGEILAGRIYDRLKEDKNVFLDVESLRSGKFNEALYEKIEECTDFLLILPENALNRCTNKDDWVRLEIEHALKCKKNIVNVMMRNFEFPKELPETLMELPNYNGIKADNMMYFDAAIEKLKNDFLHSYKKKSIFERLSKLVFLKSTDKIDKCDKYYNKYKYKYERRNKAEETDKSKGLVNSIEESNNIERLSEKEMFEIQNDVLIRITDKENTQFIYVKIPDGVKKINDGAFENCKYIENITISNSVEKIGKHAFGNCKLLKSIVIPDSVKVIDDSAFYGCISLKSVRIPHGVVKIGVNPFELCYCLNTIGVDESSINYRSVNGSLLSKDMTKLIAVPGNLKEYIISDSVRIIGKAAFSGCRSLDNIVIPESVIKIEAGAFFRCNSLKNISLPNGITEIEENMFAYCDSITNITIPKNVKELGKRAFGYCSSLSTVVVSKQTQITEDTFEGCTNFRIIENDVSDKIKSESNKSVFLDESTIGRQNTEKANEEGFKIWNGILLNVSGKRNKQFVHVEIPEGVKKIDNSVFKDCKFLEKVTIPNSVKIIGEAAFDGCSSLKSVTLSESITKIDSYAFRGCSNLTRIEIPKSVTSIGYSAFGYCRNLKSIKTDKDNSNYTSKNGVLFSKNMERLIAFPCGMGEIYIIPNSVKIIGEAAFDGCEFLTRIEIPNSVTSIGFSAFSFCRNLKSIKIPNSVIKIDKCAFFGCTSLKDVTIPQSVKIIGKGAFEYCYSLRTITLSNQTQIEEDVFRGCSDFKIIYTSEKSFQDGFLREF